MSEALTRIGLLDRQCGYFDSYFGCSPQEKDLAYLVWVYLTPCIQSGAARFQVETLSAD